MVDVTHINFVAFKMISAIYLSALIPGSANCPVLKQLSERIRVQRLVEGIREGVEEGLPQLLSFFFVSRVLLVVSWVEVEGGGSEVHHR